MSVKNIKRPVTKLNDYNKHRVVRKSAEAAMAQLKEEFQAELEPGQVVIGSYSVKTEEHQRMRLCSRDDAPVRLENEGITDEKLAEIGLTRDQIVNALTVHSTARQFLVKKQ